MARCRIFVELQSIGSSAHGDSPGKNTGVGLPFPPPGDLPDPGVRPVSPALANGFFTAEPLGKPSKGLPLTNLLFPF